MGCWHPDTTLNVRNLLKLVRKEVAKESAQPKLTVATASAKTVSVVERLAGSGPGRDLSALTGEMRIFPNYSRSARKAVAGARIHQSRHPRYRLIRAARFAR